MATRTIDVDVLIETLGIDRADQVLAVLGIDLASSDPDLSAAAEWHCGVEDAWWAIEGRQINLSDCYAIRWTATAEAGISDVEVLERLADQSAEGAELSAWLADIAANCGSCDGTVRSA